MSHQRFRFEKRKSVADFLSENIPNHFLYRCLKANTNLPDETILQAFNEAYQLCINILAEPDIQNARSTALPEMGRSAPRSSLLNYSFAYFLLSFHEEVANLRPLLFNVGAMLDTQLPEVFKPLADSAERLAPLFPATINFEQVPAMALPPPNSSLASDQFVRIPTLMILAERLSNHDATLVLSVVEQALAFDKGDWSKILKDFIDRFSWRIEPRCLHSKFYIDQDQKTTFVKIMKALLDLRIIKNIDGTFASDLDSFTADLGELFNTDLHDPYVMLSKAKSTKIYMKPFAKLCVVAKRFRDKGLGLKGKGSELTVNDLAQLLDFPAE